MRTRELCKPLYARFDGQLQLTHRELYNFVQIRAQVRAARVTGVAIAPPLQHATAAARAGCRREVFRP